MRCSFLLIGALLSTCVLHGQDLPPAPAPPGDPVREACAAPAFRQFDFWIGTWLVTDSTGTEIGSSEITREADGCAIREAWKGRVAGTSLNYFDPETDRWHQHWVGGGGLILHLRGGLEGQAMILAGERSTPQGRVMDRISWRPMQDGRVRQEWETSTDQGERWQRVFLGFYRKR